jgi:hypothetical protein
LHHWEQERFAALARHVRCGSRIVDNITGDGLMTDSAHASLRRALVDIASRRTVLGAAIAGTVGMLANAPDGDAKKKKRKKRCKNGAKRCGKSCCKAPSVCSAGSCFCTGNEGNCKSIPEELIALIAEALGIPPEQIEANPEQPLAQCPLIAEQEKGEINFAIEKEFGTTGPVNWCEGGIQAGVEDSLGQITIKG